MSKNLTVFKAIMPLFLIIIIDSMGYGLFFPVLSPLFMSPSGMLPIHASEALRNSAYGLTLGLFAVSMFFGAPMLGDWSDSIGRKKVLLIGLFGTAISSVVCAVAIQYSSLSWLFIGRIAAGFVAGCQPIAQAAIIDISDQSNKTANLGLGALAACLGFVVGPIVGGFLSDSSVVSWFNYATPFYADALLALLNGLLLYWLYQQTTVTRKVLTINFKRQLRIFTEAFLQRNIRVLCLVLLCYEVAWSLYFQFIALYLVQQHSYSPKNIGIFMSFVGLVLAVTYVVIIKLLLMFLSERTIALFSFILSGISLLLPVFFPTLFAQWLLVIPIAIGVGLGYNTLLTLFSNAVSEEQQGWIMGVTSAVVSISWIVGAILTASLDYISTTLPFIGGCIIMLMAAVSLHFTRLKTASESVVTSVFDVE